MIQSIPINSVHSNPSQSNSIQWNNNSYPSFQFFLFVNHFIVSLFVCFFYFIFFLLAATFPFHDWFALFHFLHREHFHSTDLPKLTTTVFSGKNVKVASTPKPGTSMEPMSKYDPILEQVGEQRLYKHVTM